MYVIAYKIEATDAGTPAYGCRMESEGIIARYWDREEAQETARESLSFMERAGYTVRHRVVDVPTVVLDYAESTRYALTPDDISWDVFENQGTRYGVNVNV